ncbi:MAG TPA: mannose-1-phosphate guanylyltransferase [Phycisphaerales bacterium]|nr:mannose-1-phosphate guanylyltransferase [Phycisphaerales bacterium]
MRYAMIMAGGAGTRLWPMSRSAQPKQLLPLIRDHHPKGETAMSLLQVSAQRMDGLVPPERRFICTGEAYREPIRAALPQFTDDRILGEPAARDTVNAVGFTAAVLHKLDKEAVFAVFTADHVIEPQDVFRQRVEIGFRLVEQDPSRLVTFSIKPTYPATGFGYIERGAPINENGGWAAGAFNVARYVEKPNLARAEAYLASGMFSWNSGMFVWKAATVLDCIKRFKPESYDGLMKIQGAWGTPQQNAVLNEVYPTLPKISVDYAIMEPASTDKLVKVCTVEMDLKWLDVGSWPSYGQTLPADPAGNRRGGVLSADNAVLINSSGNLVVSSDPSHTVSLLGCDNLIVVHTPDATLVMPRDKAEDLKLVHAALKPRLK